MRLFGTPAVKELKKQAELVGSLRGLVHLGRISPADLADVVHSDDYCTRLRSAFVAASADVGEKKALKAATSTARIHAEAQARLGHRKFECLAVQILADDVRLPLFESRGEPTP